MCKICDNENLEGLNHLFIENCSNITNIPIIEGLTLLSININNIPVIEGLELLNINNCPNITNITIINKCQNINNIPIIKGLRFLSIRDCPNITNITIMGGANILQVLNCDNINNIPFLEGLEGLELTNCNKIYNYNNLLYNEINKYTIEQFNKINKIKQWYKRIKLSKKLWMYAELVIIDSMNPHKENNSYLENYIEEKVYKE